MPMQPALWIRVRISWIPLTMVNPEGRDTSCMGHFGPAVHAANVWTQIRSSAWICWSRRKIQREAGSRPIHRRAMGKGLDQVAMLEKSGMGIRPRQYLGVRELSTTSSTYSMDKRRTDTKLFMGVPFWSLRICIRVVEAQ
jgi:hypothetical protein